ncbi:5-oxoprolinase [Coprinopsis marcescibilis]|uniref:5-oxoprolinase n=1 Tax=Coprinopsis marcescibilis TaxID=230819 RepID=A0A5C3L8A0_COPMA|nr:5-oxoprolinase [Coprinopsis marcescibilis]
MSIPNGSIRICADRGGTFCDVHASYPDPEDHSQRKELVVKLLSQDTSNYADAPTEGIRRVLEQVTGKSIPRGTILPTEKIDYIRLSTTIATNALLERKGHKHALLITKGFSDLLLIGNQSRPKIFDLNIRRPPPLYSEVLEVDERVTLVGYTSDPQFEEHRIVFGEDGSISRAYSGRENIVGDGRIVQGLSGEAVKIIKTPDVESVRSDLQALYDRGYRSLAIILVHSYTFPEHERLVGQIAREVGFTHVSESSALLPMIKMVPRGVSSTADAYLTPILKEYLDGFFSGFDEGLRAGPSPTGERTARVEFMSSDGGLVDLRNFSGLKSILSGPAGGVVGYALTTYDANLSKKSGESHGVGRGKPVIGLDVGGTSTDVSRFHGRYEVVYETTTAGVTIQSPQLDINTVAAGGGSCLTFSNGLFRAGPESAGAQPGPACYRKGGPLAVTDANLLLGRLVPAYFPHIFGKSEKEPLDVNASRVLFEELAQRINSESAESDGKGLDEIVYGFIKVANETMCRPIRALTEARGYATGEHVLASFGGAGGQHACEIAKLLGIRTVVIHRYSSILSAYGLALADRAYDLQEPCSTFYTPDNVSHLLGRLDTLTEKVKTELTAQGFEEHRVKVERLLNMRFEGTDTALMVLPHEKEGEDGHAEDYLEAFKRVYKTEFGFVLEGKGVIVDDIKVRGIGKTFDTLGPSIYDEVDELYEGNRVNALTPSSPWVSSPAAEDSGSFKAHYPKAEPQPQSVYFEPPVGRVENTPLYLLHQLEVGDVVNGPAMIIDDTQTIVVIPGSSALVTSRGLYIKV